MLPILGHIRARLADLAKLKWTFDKVAFAAFHRGFLFAFAHEFPEVLSVQLRLRIEGVNVRRPAFHHQEDAACRLRLEMTGLRCERVGLVRCASSARQQRCERHTAEAGTETV